MDEQMKIDAMQVRKLREARAWSQEHLAAVAGLSPRTIQRVEAEGAASPETRLAIAAAFGVAPDELLPRALPASAPQALAGPVPDERAARRQQQHRVLAISVLWAATIIAASAMGGSTLLCTAVLPAMALASIWVLGAGQPARQRRCVARE